MALTLGLAANTPPASAEGLGRTDVIDPLTFRMWNQRHAIARAASNESKQALSGYGAVAQGVVNHGGTAVVDDSGGVFQQAFPFDLNGLTLAFKPADERAGGYRYVLEPTSFSPDQGETLSLGDDDSIEISLGFTFPFFGVAYDAVWLNSDGNLTFNEADSESTPRDAARVLTGEPRICPFFSDLDPSASGARISIERPSGAVVIRWVGVPPFTSDGAGSRQTFQAMLLEDGEIRFSFQEVDLNDGLTGISSGREVSSARSVDFSRASDDVFKASVIEVFQEASFDLAALTRKFYSEFEDAYDFIVIFHDFDLGFESTSFAFYLPVRNFVLGIGFWPPPLESRNLVDIGNLLGSPRRLQGLMFMGLLEKYSDDPFGRIDAGFGLGLNNPMTILAHEAGHRFLARTLFVDHESNVFSTELLGRQLGHWSYFFNSDASLLEGNRIVDHGAGDFRFETVSTVEGYSSLDLYLMGLIEAGEVPDTFFVRDPDIADSLFAPEHEPLAGVFFDGNRVDIAIEDIVEAHGRRVPDATISQKNFRYAFVLAHRVGRPPSAASIEKMERFRTAFEGYFDQATGGRAGAETQLRRELAFSSWPAAGILAGDSVQVALFLPEAATEPIDVDLTSDSAAVSVGEGVTIPIGADFVPVAVKGVRDGVARIEASAGPAFETARTAIRVHGSPRLIRAERILPLEILFGDPRERLKTGQVGQPLPYRIFAQATDENLLALGGVRIEITASGDGIAVPGQAVTDSFGFISVEWTLASSPGPNRLTISIPGSRQPDLVVDAIGTRAPLRQRNLRRQLFGQ